MDPQPPQNQDGQPNPPRNDQPDRQGQSGDDAGYQPAPEQPAQSQPIQSGQQPPYHGVNITPPQSSRPPEQPAQEPEPSQQPQPAQPAADTPDEYTPGSEEAVSMARDKIASIPDTYQQPQPYIPPHLESATPPGPPQQPPEQPAPQQPQAPRQGPQPQPAQPTAQPQPEQPAQEPEPSQQPPVSEPSQPAQQPPSEAPTTESDGFPDQFEAALSRNQELAQQATPTYQPPPDDTSQFATFQIPPRPQASQPQPEQPTQATPPEQSAPQPPAPQEPNQPAQPQPAGASPLQPPTSMPQPQPPAPTTQNQYVTPAMPQAAEQPPQEQPPPVSNLNQAIKPANVMGRFRSYVGSKVNDYAATQPSISGRLKHVVFALLIGTGIFLVFNSQIILGQIGYLTNSGAGENTPVITEASTNTPVGPEPRIIIPKINVNVPVVYDVKSFNEQKVQQALERGVVHYGTTAVPGQSGNNVIVGHSSNNWWASGKYKFAFVLLDKLETGDTFVLHYKSQRYVYEVFKKFVTAPDDLSVIQPTKEPVTTLITCTPPGTSWKRLIVQAKQISPEPDTSPAQEGDLPVETIESPLPGNPPSFWDKVRNWLFGTN